MDRTTSACAAILLGCGMAFISYLLNSNLNNLGSGALFVLYGPGFLVGLAGLIFVGGSFKNAFGPFLFVLIAGLSFAIGLQASVASAGPGSNSTMNSVYITTIIIGTLINLFQLLLLKKDASAKWRNGAVGVWLLYSLVMLTALTPVVNGMFPENSDSSVINSSNGNMNILVMESLWQIGFYMMLVFYTYRERVVLR